jgi:ABC-type phosphate transport system substrate-binding protein
MTGFSARRLAITLAISSASVIAALSGAASASATAQIKGQGSTLQEFAQQKVFIPAYNAKLEGEITEYKGTGSGAGLEAWGNGTHAAEFNTWEYVGTDQPPNATQKSAIETKAGGATVLSIPTLQAAVTVSYHLPESCTSVTSKAKKQTGRMALSPLTIEKIFKHTITKWSEIPGNTLNPSGCATGHEEITRVVRLEGSGTTAIFKKFLFQINQAPVDETKNWNNLAEENKNLSWPAEAENLERGKGNPGVAAGIVAKAGSIGYVNLADAYADGFKESGTNEGWAVVQHNEGAKKAAYASPELPGKKVKINKKKVILEGTSNCVGTSYVNGAGAKFPPKTTEEAWNEVSSTPVEPNYPICGFTYDLSLKGFSSIEPALRPTTEQVELVKKYFTFMVKEGPTLLPGTDYEALPENAEEEKSVAKIAAKGVEKIS